VSLVSPESPEAEYYQRLRLTVEQWHQNDMGQVLAITSPSPGDGKTVTVLNLAGSLARAKEARVLVIDADLRQPSVDRYLGLASSGGGLNAMISNGGRLEEGILSHARFNLHILPTTPATRAPYEVLNSTRLHELLLRVREDFDYILIDSPPLLYPDFSLIKTHVDGSLIVIAAHRTPRKAVEDAVASLGGSKLIGIVFNRDTQQRSGRHYKSYRKRPRS
jgi:capsular exopolysaccharide synthesis family protein